MVGELLWANDLVVFKIQIPQSSDTLHDMVWDCVIEAIYVDFQQGANKLLSFGVKSDMASFLFLQVQHHHQSV